MPTLELIHWNPALNKASATEVAIALKNNLLASARAILSIDNEMDLAVATEEMKALKGQILTPAEDARESLVRPHLDANKDINGKVKEYVKEPTEQYNRISTLVSGYLKKQQEKKEEEERLRRKAAQDLIDEAARIERERLAAQAKAKADQERLERERLDSIAAAVNAEQRKKAEADYAIQQQALKIQEAKQEEERIRAEALLDSRKAIEVVKAPQPRPEGLVQRGDWKMEVLNLHKIYDAHPELIKLELNVAAANLAMKAGLRECDGAKISWVIKANVRGE